jgi:23S rRNA A2030 N6-methylase RlmJ
VVAEVRLRPLTNPMKMNGCAMVVVNPPAGTDEAAAEICSWVAGTLGESRSEVRGLASLTRRTCARFRTVRDKFHR